MYESHLVSEYHSRKRSLRELSSHVALTRMVYHNINDLIPRQWNVEITGEKYIKISPAVNNVDASQFDKLTAKLAKAFQKQPYMHVDRDSFCASFYVYPFREGWNSKYVSIDITTDNKENCDFIETESVVKSYEATGYCKVLQERQYKLQ